LPFSDVAGAEIAHVEVIGHGRRDNTLFKPLQMQQPSKNEKPADFDGLGSVFGFSLSMMSYGQRESGKGSWKRSFR
jgi:hypothetical protein